jgi:hypothetical protein
VYCWRAVVQVMLACGHDGRCSRAELRWSRVARGDETEQPRKFTSGTFVLPQPVSVMVGDSPTRSKSASLRACSSPGRVRGPSMMPGGRAGLPRGVPFAGACRSVAGGAWTVWEVGVAGGRCPIGAPGAGEAYGGLLGRWRSRAAWLRCLLASAMETRRAETRSSRGSVPPLGGMTARPPLLRGRRPD